VVDRPKVSAVLNTLNEEKNIVFSLRSVRTWVDEIILVDMHSEDATVAVAREFGAKVYFHERVGFADPARAFAIAQASGDWIFMLDADEVVPAGLSNRLLSIASQDKADVVVIPWLNYLLGSPLLHTGWGPDNDKHPRFFKKGYLEATDTIHRFLRTRPDARTIELSYEPGFAVVHFNYLDISHFLEKLNRYTSIEADQAFGRGERSTPGVALFQAAKEFCKRYLRHRGYLDGWRGFYLSLMMSFYRIAVYGKLKEIETNGPREAVENHYAMEAERWLIQYEKK
jgi:glycosyltransferase involved in cell wall biosynthesis